MSNNSEEAQLQHIDRTTKIEESDDRSWLFTAEGFTLDASHQAKKLVADSVEDVDYGDLRSRKVNPGNTLGDEYVCVVEVL